MLTTTYGYPKLQTSHFQKVLQGDTFCRFQCKDRSIVRGTVGEQDQECFKSLTSANFVMFVGSWHRFRVRNGQSTRPVLAGLLGIYFLPRIENNLPDLAMHNRDSVTVIWIKYYCLSEENCVTFSLSEVTECTDDLYQSSIV